LQRDNRSYSIKFGNFGERPHAEHLKRVDAIVAALSVSTPYLFWRTGIWR
jgi:hypothetical protein